MKVLLANAPWHLTRNGKMYLGCRAGSRWPFLQDYHGSMISSYRPFPFFLATASALLKKNGFLVNVRDSIAIGEYYDYFYSYVEECNPDLIMLEVATPSIYNDLEVVRRIKEILPDTKVVLAGLHAPIAEKEFMEENPFVDFTIYGEYEHPLLKLAINLDEGRDFGDVPNLLYRNEMGNIKKNNRERLVPLNELPWPDRDGLPTTYYDGSGGMPGLELQLQTTRGCPYHCNFCVWPQLMYAGPEYRMRDPKDVVQEILVNFEKAPYTHFYFDDDTINLNKEHFLGLCKEIKANGLDKYQWACMGRGDLMDDEMLQAMKDAGCYGIKYGVESFNQDILDKTGKALNIEKNIENIKKTRALGIKVHLTYCLGLMGDTRETVEDTIKKSLELEADSRQYSIATPYLGSKLWQEYKENGLLETEDLSMFDGLHTAVARHEDLPPEELMRMRDEAELMSSMEIAGRLQSPFATVVFEEKIVKNVEGAKKILITGTAQRALVKRIWKILTERGITTNILTHEKYLPEYEDLPSDCLISFLDPTSFCLNDMKKLTNKLRANFYDCVIIPSRSYSTSGMENVIEVAQDISDNIVMTYENAEVGKV
ncbi:B12-binding domain-containing radical SAM protein [Butyrivibrio sp. VCB2001]|uniref:B12-binding domain-containing radical SAM protein n=1 Tax=Butyrivibrio sp. VCB2001 TaxID=1280667 RepID=UPI00040BD0BA|nr:B12-binding domain-containing radical SAM protein [Butyrivibrio sp. VCB2001]